MNQDQEPRARAGEKPLAEARTLFQKANLPFPPIPEELAPRVTRLSEWLYGTRSGAPSPYNLRAFLAELEHAVSPPDYLLLGQAGHGFDSWAMHYYLVRGRLALFLQIEWGGAHTDGDTAAARVAELFDGAAQLIQAVEAAEHGGRHALHGHLLVVSSSFHGSGWTWLRERPEPDVSSLRLWLQPPSAPLRQALEDVRAR